jgi:hypothetical protein
MPTDCPSNKPVWLVFQALDGAARVWLNGKFAGQQLNVGTMWFKPWALEVSALVRGGKTNRLVIQVTKDMGDPGIWKPVEIRCAS